MFAFWLINWARKALTAPNCHLTGASLTVSQPTFSIQWNVKLINSNYFYIACTAERCFRVDRAQENLHYVTDIATDVIYVLDQESPTLPQTPENENSPNILNPIISSLESSDKDSHDGTPLTPSKKFFNRSLSSGPNSGGTSSSRKSSQGSQGSNGSARSSLNASKEDIDNAGNGDSANYKAWVDFSCMITITWSVKYQGMDNFILKNSKNKKSFHPLSHHSASSTFSHNYSTLERYNDNGKYLHA